MDDMVIVRLPDGKDYSLPYNAVTLDGSEILAPGDLQGIMTALKPHLKNVNFLNDLAKVMQRSGVHEFHVKDGEIKTFLSKESLVERTARYKAEALAEAEKRAKEDHDKENMAII